MRKLKPVYGGAPSRPFWNRIANLPDGDVKSAIYALAVALSDIEGSVLRLIEDQELSHSRKGVKCD